MSNAEEPESGTSAEAEQAEPVSKAPGSTEPDESLDEASRDRFVRDLIERGEVVPKGEDLPAGATHELEVEDGQQILHRRRFSAY